MICGSFLRHWFSKQRGGERSDVCVRCGIPRPAFMNPPRWNQWKGLSDLEHWYRLWANVEKSTGCWNWTASIRGRYPKFMFRNKRWSAHRLVYIFVHGPINGGLHVLHKCDNTLCVRPDHLFLGTHLDNMRDAQAKKRFPWQKANAA